MNIAQAAKSFGQFLKKVVCVTATFTVVVGGTYLYTKHQFEQQFKREAQAAIEAERAKAYGEFGATVHAVAQMFVGEAKGQPEEWEQMFSAIVVRFESGRHGENIETTIKECSDSGPCQINAMGDTVMEIMTSAVGQVALLEAERLVELYESGEWRPLNQAHSWATPKAAEGHKYFDGLRLVATYPGHNYYADRNFAPLTSLRPEARPSSIDDAVRLALEF